MASEINISNIKGMINELNKKIDNLKKRRAGGVDSVTFRWMGESCPAELGSTTERELAGVLHDAIIKRLESELAVLIEARDKAEAALAEIFKREEV